MEEESEEPDGPWLLPVVQHGQTQYFADLRLRQFRNVLKPHEYWDFESEKGPADVQVLRHCDVPGMQDGGHHFAGLG